MSRQRELFKVVDALGAAGRSRADWTAGNSSAIKTLVMAITTSSSIRVKPASARLSLFDFIVLLPSLQRIKSRKPHQ